MLEFLIGIGGIVIGILFNELIRRMNRIEELNKQIFNKRMDEYIALHALMNKQYSLLGEMIESLEDYSQDERNKMSSILIFPIAQFNDRSFFISEELAVQTTSLFMGVEDVEIKELSEYEKKIGQAFKNTMQMIKNESGVARVNEKYKRMFNYHHKSDILDYYSKIKREKR